MKRLIALLGIYSVASQKKTPGNNSKNSLSATVNPLKFKDWTKEAGC